MSLTIKIVWHFEFIHYRSSRQLPVTSSSSRSTIQFLYKALLAFFIIPQSSINYSVCRHPSHFPSLSSNFSTTTTINQGPTMGYYYYSNDLPVAVIVIIVLLPIFCCIGVGVTVCCICKKQNRKKREREEARIRLQEQYAKNANAQQQQNTMMQPVQVQSPQPSAPMFPLQPPHQYPPGTPPSTPYSHPEVSPYPPTQPSSTAGQAPGFHLPTRSPPVPVAPPYPYPPAGTAPIQTTKSTTGWNSEALKPQPQPGILRMTSRSTGTATATTNEWNPRAKGSVRVVLQPAVVHHASPAKENARSVAARERTSKSNRSSGKK